MRHDKVGFRREGRHHPRSRCELATSTCQLFRHLAVWGRLDSIGTTIFDTGVEFSLQLSFPSLISVKHIVAPSPVRNSNGTHGMKTTNSDDNSECPRVFSHTRLCDTLNKARLLAFLAGDPAPPCCNSPNTNAGICGARFSQTFHK